MSATFISSHSQDGGSSQMNTAAIKTCESDGPTNNLGEVYCGICQRQTSRYTCPSCNLLYCSLSCFRSEPHSRCSETFYRKEIEIGIKSSKTEGDKNKIIELLKQIEDQDSADEDGLLHDSGEENESLAHQISLLNISSASADDLLGLLTKQEKNKFFAALKDESSGLVQELLESPEIRETRRLPWWEAPSDCGQASIESPPSRRVSHGVEPDLMVVPTNLINQASHGISLLYNICAVLLSYAYVTRHLSMSPLASMKNDSQDQHEACRILSQSLPFLVDRKSTLRHVSVADAVLSFWSKIDPVSIDNRAMLILLGDVAKLLRPRRITSTEHSTREQGKAVALMKDHPLSAAIMALSDVSSLFNAFSSASRRSHVMMKLTFYVAHILSTPFSYLHALTDKINLFAKRIAEEAH